MVDNNQHQEKPQDFELIELLFGKVDSSTSNAVDQLDQSFEARYQSLVDQIQSYLHSSEKPGFFPHRFLGSFSSVLDTKLNDKLGIKKLHFRFEGARTLKIVAETESKTHVFIFTEDIEAQHSKQTNTKNFEFTTGEWKNMMGRDYTPLDKRKLQIDVIKILKDKYELVKSRPKSDKDVKSKKLHLYLKNNVLEYKAKDIYGNIQTMQIDSGELKGNDAFKNKFFDEIKQFLSKSGKDLSDDVRKELSRFTSVKGYTLKSDGEDEKINIKVESKKKIVDQPIEPTVKFQEVTKKLGKSIYLEDYIEKLASPDEKQVQDNLKVILGYIKEVHANLNLQGNVYGIKAREAGQHGFVAGIFDNFRYRDNTKLYLEQFAGGGYADIVLLVRGPNRAVDSVPILIELKAGSEGQVDPSDALRQAENYIKGFRPNKMRVLTNADNAIAVGLNLDNAEPFKTEVKPIKQPSAPLMEEFVKLAHRWNNQQISEEDFKQKIAGLLSSEYHTFPANKETKDHYYFSRDILGQSILVNKIGQDQGNIKKYIYSYDEYPLNWPQGTEYTLSKSPVTTLIFVQGNEGQEKTAFIFHIRESNTKKFYADKKIPVLNIPGIGEVKNVIETKMSLRKYETGLSFEELFEIEQVSKYKPSRADQQFTGSFLEIPNADELKVKLDQAITSQHVSDGEVSLQAYKMWLTEVADTIYPIKDLITNEARLQAVLNGLLSSYSDLKLQETSAKTVIIPEFQTGAGGRVDMVIQGIGPSSQGTKEYIPIALEFKLIDKNLNQDKLKQEVDKLTKEQNIRYAKGAALKAITDSDKMLFMGVVVNVKAQDKDSLILTSDELISAKVSHSSIDVVKEKHLKDIKQLIQRLKSTTIKETLESATIEKDYHYWLQQHDIADIARVQYGYRIDGTGTLFEVVGSPEHIVSQLEQFQNRVTTGDERRPLTLIVNLDNNHWVTLVITHQNGQYNGYYVDSLGNDIPGNIRQVLQRARITVNDVSIAQQIDGHNCGLWALENARDINAVLQGGRSNIPNEIRNRLQGQGRDENYFIRMREDVSEALSIDPQRIANLDEAILAETQQSRKKPNQNTRKNFNPNSCVGQGSRGKRSINLCLFSKDDIEKFSKGEIDESDIDKIIVDSEKFLTYVKNSQDEAKNAQLVEFIGDKNIEGDYKYLVDKVIGDQGYERYIQNERIKDLYGNVLQQNGDFTKNQKLKNSLMNAAGGIQLIRGIHGAIVSCQDGVTTGCGLNLGGIGWSFASQPIENVMVKITPKVVASAEKVAGKIVSGTLGKQTKFAIRIAGVKFGSTIAKGAAGAISGVFDIVDIGISTSNLVDCKKRENSDNPCGEKEIRDNIASISFSSVSFISGVALTAAGMPVIGTAVGFWLMVGYGIYSGISNVIEYKEKYNTTPGEDWSIFLRSSLSLPMAQDVQYLTARRNIVNSIAQEAWRALNSSTDGVVAYAVGFGDMIQKVSVNCKPSGPCTCDTNQFGVGFHKKCDLIELSDKAGHAVIAMDKKSNANMKNLSRVIPDNTKGASMICLPQITNQDYEKGRTSSVPSAEYYCENAMVISHNSRVSMKQKDKTIVYDLRNVDRGNIVGNNVWNNNFLIYSGTERITGGNNVVNRFVLVDNIDFSGKMIGGNNSTNILDLSQLKDTVVGVKFNYRFKPNASGPLKAIVNNRLLINDSIDNNGIFNYYYVGRKNKVDEVLCMGYSEHFTGTDDRDVIIDSGGGSNNNEKDIVENCKKVIISPYTTVKGRKSHYTFYVKTADYKGRGLYSEIDVDGTGTVVFPEIDLLGGCDQITYSVNSNTLSLKVNFGQNNQFTLDIKNYVEKSSNKPHFVLIDKNGSNIIPKIERSDSSTIEIKSFELHSEHPLNNFNDVENHYKKILNNHKSYKVFGVIREKVQNQDNSTAPHMFFGSSEDDIINFDQGTMVAKGGDGSDMYIVDGNVGKREIIIDNNSNDKELDTIFIQEAPRELWMQKCNLRLNYNGTNIQIENYLQNDSYRHLIVMNNKGETFIPYMPSMSCISSSMENGKLVPFFHATQTQNMFLLPKDFQDDHVVIDSNLEDIQKYKDRDDLLLIRESKIPFIIRIEDFYNDRSKWNNISYSLWNNNDFSPSLGLLENVDNIVEYKDKLRGDYERIVKEYIEDFSNSTSNIQHNQKLEKNIYTSVEQDEERIGVMILKSTTPGQVEVFSSGEDMILRDKRFNHTINIKGWNNDESYRISTLEFDSGLEPITIRRLDRFSSSEVREIQNLINKASENYQNRSKYTLEVENDFKCLISVDGFESESKEPTYQCLGFSSLHDQINFAKSVCSAEQIEEFMGKIPSNIQVLSLLIKLHNDLLLSGYDKNTIDKCNYSMITSKSEISKLLYLVAEMNDLPGVEFLLDNGANVEIKGDNDRALLNIAACNGNLNMTKLIYNRIEAKSNDPSKMMKLTESLKEEIISQADIQADVKEWAKSRISDLRNSIKDIVVKRLKDGMLNDRYTVTIELAKETYIFENKLFSDVIKEVINDVYGKVDTEKILSFIHSHDQIEQKAYGYVAVFEEMESKNNLNDNAVFKLAYYVKEIIDSEKRSDLESLKNRLPESVKNAVFSSKVCIKNVEYGRYLYSPNDDCMYHLNDCDSDRRYVFTWPSNGNSDQFKWKVEFNGDNVYLKNIEYGRYLYSPNDDCTYHLNNCDSDRRYAFTWPSNGRGGQFKWKIELNGDNVYLKNVEYGRYLYSPTDYRDFQFDNNRRYVFTWPSNGKGGQFKWKIENCGSTMKKRDVINQSVDIKARDNNGETSLHTAIQYSNAFNANAGFHSDIVRVPRQAKSNSEVSVYYIKGVEDGRRVQINLASSVKATGKFQSVANKIVLNREAISHLNKVRRVSGILMHGMMAKSALASFLNGDYQGVAINLGFITGSQGFSKVAEVASIKGLKLASEGKLLLSRSLKAASPFLARGTSAFVVYDLVNQVKAFKNGTEEALAGVVGDSIYLSVDAAEIGIEVAEVFEVLEGVSSVTGPVGAVVFIGTDIYMSVKRVGKIDEIVHLTGREKFIEGLRAFIGMEPEQYIGELMGEKQANDQLVKQGLEYLKQHNDTQRYVFPAVNVKEECERVPSLQGAQYGLREKKCRYSQTVDLNNTVLLDRKVSGIKWSRAKPDNPNGGEIFCFPQGDYQPASNYGLYLCRNAIGIADLSTEKRENYTLINLGEGHDLSKGFLNSPNIFIVGNGFKKYYGGNKDDMFILQGNFIEGDINGGNGVDTVDLEEFASEARSIQVKLGRSGYVSYNSSSFGIENINRISTRKDKSDTIICDYNTKYVDGRGGESNDNPDVITIPRNPHFHEMQLIIRPSTNIVNHASAGNFNYATLSDKGKALVNISLQSLLSGTPTDRHNFFFNYTLSELININIRNISRVPYYNYTIREAVFSFSSPLSQNKSINEKFNVTISDIPANASYVLSDNTEIKIGKNNLYAIHNTNKTIDEIVKSYPAVADHLRMSLFVNTNNETVVIGHGNHDVISNNFLQRSHLIGSSGENIYVITSGYEILDIENLPIPEVIVYDDFNKKESLKDTLDLRQLVQQVNSDLSIEPISNVIKDENDILIKLSVSATGLQQDVATVRLKDAFANNWYKELQIIFNNVPMKIDDDLDLKPLPLTFNEEIVVVTPQDVEEKDKLIISKEAGQYTFLHSGYDLIITNAFNADIETNKLCTIYFKDFYKESKMETLSIKFTDKEILLSNEMDKINNANSILDITNIKLSDLNKKLLTVAQDCKPNEVGDLVNQGADVNAQDNSKWTPLHRAAFRGCLDVVESLIEKDAKIDVENNINRTALHLAARKCHSSVVQSFVKKGANVNARDKNGKTPLDLASWQKQLDITSSQDCDQTIEHLGKSNQEGGNHVQRRRRHHHGDHSRHHNHLLRKPLAIDSSNQPEIAASSGTRPSSWINGLFGWVKGSVGGLFYSRAALSEEASSTASSIPQVDEQFAKASVSSSSSTSTTLPSDGTDKKQENGGFFRDNIDYVNANIKQMRDRQTPVKFKPSGGNTILEMGDHYLSHVDFNGTIMLLDLLIRKVTGQKYISTVDQSISPLEAQGYALNITKGFEKVVEQAGLKSGVSMHRLNIDFVEIQKEVTGKIMSGKFDEISGVLNSYLEEACPGREAGCPGKLSPKKFDKFIAQFNKGLLNQSIEQILHNRDGRLEVDDAKQMSLEPQSYLSNASVHSHSKVSTCLSEIGVTKLGVNLNR